MTRNAILAALTLILLGAPAWAEIELGLGVAPSLIETEQGEGEDDDLAIALHAGYSFLWLFYASADALILPPQMVQSFTSSIDENGFIREGIFRPGMLNLFDVGIRPRIGPVALMAEVGINQLYIYKEEELPEDYEPPKLGVNLRLARISHTILRIHFPGGKTA